MPHRATTQQTAAYLVVFEKSSRQILGLYLGSAPSAGIFKLLQETLSSSYQIPARGILWLIASKPWLQLRSDEWVDTQKLLNILRPQTIFYSVGRDNSSGLPHQNTIENFETIESLSVGTSQVGDFEVFF